MSVRPLLRSRVVTSPRVNPMLVSGVGRGVMDETIGLTVLPSGSRDDVVAALFDAEFASLVGLARQLVDSRAEAEEVVQDAFARLYVALGRLRSPDKAAAYLRATTLNLCRSRLRRRRVARLRPDPGPERPATGVDDDAVDASLAPRVRAAVAKLPRRQMDCVLLRYYAGLSDAEIAATLGIALGTVKTSLHRARNELARRLEDLR
jgi:RNA polymerase sigma-70 factor (sigma-E family)